MKTNSKNANENPGGSAPADMVVDLVLYGMAQEGKSLLRHLRAQDRKRVDAPLKPSLRGAPKPREVRGAWIITPRTLADRLRIGSRLVDLEPTVDNSFVFAADLCGRRTIVRRHSGIKGWLKEHCPEVGYSTAMRYKKVASRLRSVCGVSAEIPLEWLLSDARDDLSNLTEADLAAVQAGRKKLAALMVEFPNIDRLKTEVEKRLGKVRFPSKRQAKILISKRGERGEIRRGRGGSNAGKNHRENSRRGFAEAEAARLARREAAWLAQWRGNCAGAAAFALEVVQHLRCLKRPNVWERWVLAAWDRFEAQRVLAEH